MEEREFHRDLGLSDLDLQREGLFDGGMRSQPSGEGGGAWSVTGIGAGAGLKGGEACSGDRTEWVPSEQGTQP